MKHSPRPLRFLPIVLAACAAFAGAPPLRAAALLLDFGPTTIATATDATNSPGHAALAVSGTTWNKVTNSNISSGLLFDNGDAAAGISISLARETATGSMILDFANTTSANINASSLTGTSAATLGSDYRNSTAPPAMDGIFIAGSSTANDAAIGLRIDGLAAGEYVIYFVGRNTNNATEARPVDFFASASATASLFDFSSLDAVSLSNANTSANATWVEGNQYNTATITITGTGQSLYLAAVGASSADLRGFINSVEIVAVPEPAAWAMAIGGLGLLAAGRRRGRLN